MKFEKFNKKHLLEIIKEEYTMPIDLKRDLVSKNLKVLLKVMPLITVAGLIMLIITYINSGNDLFTNRYNFIYHGCAFFFGLQTISYLFVAHKHVEWNPTKRNRGLFMSYFLLMTLCTYSFIFSENQLRAFITFSIVSVLAVSFFTFEPLGFIPQTTIFMTILVIVSIRNRDFGSSAYLLLYYFVISYFSMTKWRTLINNQKFSKNLKIHAENLEKEITLASYVQQSFYKSDLTGLDNYDIRVYSKAMSGVSGDLYDFYRDENHLDGLGIFDVSGHGVASGLITMLVRNIIHQEFYKNKNKPFEEVVQIIDKRIKEEKGIVENYLSGVLIRIDDNSLEVINAGHPNPILYRHNIDGIYYLDNEKKYSSTVLGMRAIDSFYKSFTVEMNRDDELVLYTDGITEAFNKQREPFGTVRLSEAINKMMVMDFNEQLPYLVEQISTFTDGCTPSDDITMIIIKKK